jgi:hypothetical protein
MLLYQVMNASLHLCAELMTLIFEVIALRFDLFDTFPDGVSYACHGGSTRPMMLLGCPSLGGGGRLWRVSLLS